MLLGVDAGRSEPRPYKVSNNEGAALEVAAEFAEGWEDYQLAGAGYHGFVLELPGVLVGDVDGV